MAGSRSASAQVGDERPVGPTRPEPGTRDDGGMVDQELSGWASRGRVVTDEGVLPDGVVVVEGDRIVRYDLCIPQLLGAVRTGVFPL